MYADLVLYSEPKRPLINPKFDLFAWLDVQHEPNLLFPARVIDRIHLMLPEKCKTAEMTADMWEFITWQTEQKGYTIVRSIDTDWFYWSMLADKYTLLNMARMLI
jgi:hypothetical protein